MNINEINQPSLQKPISEKWIPLGDVMSFFKYGATQMAALLNKGELIVSKIGKRKFIHRDSLEKLLDSRVITPKKEI